MRVAILYGEPGCGPDEADALAQVAAVSEALHVLGHEVEALPPLTLDLAAAGESLRAARPDVVMNLVDTVSGSGALIHLAPALLEHLGVPFTGAGSVATLLTSHKPTGKGLLAAAGIDTPPWITASGETPAGAPAGPVIVKSAWEHASVGLDECSLIPLASLAPAAIRARAASPGGEWFAEGYIEGREINVAFLPGTDGGPPEALPPSEIVFSGPGPRILGYRAKWEPESPEYAGTPRTFAFSGTDAPLLSLLREIALRCYRLFSLRGAARVDFRVDAHGRPWVLEVNVNPCLSPDAGFAAALAAAGIPFTAAVSRILSDAFARHSP